MKKLQGLTFIILKIFLVITTITITLLIIGSIISNLINKGITGKPELAVDSFALLFAFGAMLFGWSRSVREDSLQFSTKLYKLGELCIYNSLLFLLAAVLRFYLDNATNIFIENNTFFTALTSFSRIIYLILYFISFIRTFYLLYLFIILLSKKNSGR